MKHHQRHLRRLELAWHSTEPNTFGTDEFMTWCRLAGVEPMMALNLGTRGEEDAVNLLDYVNGRADTDYANLRRANGRDEPYDVRMWCLGNEMDCPCRHCRFGAGSLPFMASCPTFSLWRKVRDSIDEILPACATSPPSSAGGRL